MNEFVTQIAEDKGRNRFRPVPPGVERPRDVFLRAVDELVEPLVGAGYRYARSGPHASRKDRGITSRVSFGSSNLNVPGELVSLHITLQALDAGLGAWRKEQPIPRRSDDLVATWHLGHLLNPPRWLDWNLAAPEDRVATVRDISETLRESGLPFVEALVADLQAGADPDVLAGRVDDEALIEYLVRADRMTDTAPVVRAMLAHYHPRARDYFRGQVHQMRRDGLPQADAVGEPNGVAFLVAQFDLPVELD